MPKLFIVATPIGNLKDITLRAIETLRSVDLILCEDTRRAKKLLETYDIKTKLMSYHQHSTQSKVGEISELLREYDTALITDSGTPGICDPGNKLIAELVRENLNIEIVPIPGASAVTALASVSGCNTDSYTFLGFLPHKKGKETLLKFIAEANTPVIFFESPYRIFKTLERLKELLDPDRKIVLGRELTKLHETIYRGNTQQVIDLLKATSSKGEFVIMIDKKTKKTTL